jgi:hypothetical protein
MRYQIRVTIRRSSPYVQTPAMKAYGGVDVTLHAFSFSTLDEHELSALRSRGLTSDEKAPQYPMDMSPGGPYSRPDMVSEICRLLPEVKPSDVRHAAKDYSDSATPVHIHTQRC